jgi:glutamyl-Q tRNA(Asp) synthetase
MKSRSVSSTADPLADASATVEVGRFAPSPTGPLHLGSLLTAVASYLHARASGGRWLLRMEDLDTPRCIPGAADAILNTLDRHALYWDELIYQHQRIDVYRAALEQLRESGHTFACTCSRTQIQESSVYPGTCRHRSIPPDVPHSIRLVVPDETIEVLDEIQGRYAQHLRTDVGDFVIFRRDQIIAYQLAVVVDDAAQRITQVVRGADLLDNTPRQLLLFRLLGAKAPRYAHVPVLTDRGGQKLSKQTRATAVDAASPSDNLRLTLALLGHDPPNDLRRAEPSELLQWATAQWDLSRIPRRAIHSEFVCI